MAIHGIIEKTHMVGKKIILLLSFLFLLIPNSVFAYYNYSCSQYGIMATYSYLKDGCICMSGYTWGENFLGNPVCISMNQYCSDNYGLFATYDSLSANCTCSYGYVFNEDMFGNISCQYGEYVCHEKYGYHSSYNALEKTCECDEDYTFDENNQCVQKQHNVYFFMKELDTYSKEAVVVDIYNNKYYLIRYGVGCYSYTIDDYIGEVFVVNLGTDYSLDRYDGIVLQNNDMTCNITSVKKVSSDFTLLSEEY